MRLPTVPLPTYVAAAPRTGPYDWLRTKEKTIRMSMKHNTFRNEECETIHAESDRRLTAVAEMLLSRGGEVNGARGSGLTALMWAARRGYARLANLLLEEGADPSRRDNSGKTAAQHALESGNAGVARMISRYGNRRHG